MSSGNGTTVGYYIEVRNTTMLTGSALPTIGGVSIGAEWVRVPTERAPGVPTGLWCRIAEAVTELLSYPAACAIMGWAAVADVRGIGLGLGLEFRLVRAKLTYSWSVEAVAYGEPVSYRDREAKEFAP